MRIDDILVHPRDNDLIIGTHGRGIFILDEGGAGWLPEWLGADVVYGQWPGGRLTVSSSAAAKARLAASLTVTRTGART